MFRISAIIAALVLMCMPAFAESESLISQDMIKADAVNYNSEVMESGTYERTVSAGGVEFYPYTEVICVEVSGARFSEYLVSRGDEVKKGDVLARFTLDVDEVGFASLEMELERAKQEMEKTVGDTQERVLEMERSLLNVSDFVERELIRLKIQREELALEQYVFKQEHNIAKLEQRIAEMLAEQEGSVMVAPADGVILEMAFKRDGEIVRKGEILIQMYRPEGLIMCIDNTSAEMRYGRDVVIEVGPSKARVQIPGKVVGADLLIPTIERSGKAYIEFVQPEGVKLTRPNVKGTTFRLDDVITVARSSLDMDGGKYYITKLVDGVPQKRFINVMVNPSIREAWVLQGLAAGDEIIID